MQSMSPPSTAIQARARRGAKTERGRATRGSILAAARRMGSESWLDQLALAELARAAGTTRASVLFQFPDGWPDIAAELRIEEMQLWEDEIAGLVASRRKPQERLADALGFLLSRSEATGTLLPNLRAFNLFWGESIDARLLPYLDAIIDHLAALISAACRTEPEVAVARTCANALFAHALDLATLPYFRRLRPAGRQAELATAISVMLKGLNAK